MTQQAVAVIAELTRLIAAHGVFAMVIIFIFYQQRRAARNYREATAADDKKYFRRNHLSVVVATYVMTGIAIAIWFWASFIRAPKGIDGFVTELTSFAVEPEGVTGPAKIEQSVFPVHPEVRFYYFKDEWDPETGRYDLRWCLVPPHDMKVVELKFQHHYEKWKKLPSSLPTTTTGESGDDDFECGDHRGPFVKVCKTIHRTFRLNLEELIHPPAIQLVYEPEPEGQFEHIGRLSVIQGGRRIPLNWMEDSSETTADTSRVGGLSLIATAYAQDKPLFGPDGSYNANSGQALRQRLGGHELGAQIQARRILVRSGARSFKFIADSLTKEAFGKDINRALLVHNLGDAIEEIRRQGVSVPQKLDLQLANAFYSIADFDAAARHYGRVEQIPLKGLELLQRAYTWEVTGNIKGALKDYEAYVNKADPGSNKAIAYSNRANIYYNLGQRSEATKNAELAIKADPEFPNPYNNLAYYLAEQNINLEKALKLADEALDEEPDNPNFLDTKGWVLFKLKRHQEAADYLQRAAKLAPADDDIEAHLRQVMELLDKNRTSR